MQMTRRDLSPRDAMERWLASQRSDRSEESISSYYYRLKLFVEWCEDHGIETLHDMDPWTLDEYIAERQTVQPTANTRKNELTTLQSFLERCETWDVAEDGLTDVIDVPTVPPSERASQKRLAPEAATALLSYYRDGPEYATRAHALLEILWHTGARIGGVRALDVGDLHREDGSAYLAFHNRPGTDTRLKKGAAGERAVALAPAPADAIAGYIAEHRAGVTDEHGREPLIASRQGRPTKGSLRDWTYQATIPCKHSPCPHDKSPDTCVWTGYNQASKCPSSRAPHHVRTGAITWMLNQDVPAELVAKRVNASVATIEEHYDKQSPVEEMRQRREPYFGDLDIENNGDTNAE